MKPYNGFSHDQRQAALNWLNRQYASGGRVRPLECMACGQTRGLIQAHSEDYSPPHGDNIGRFAFCFLCHMMIHGRWRFPAAWVNYRALIAQGYRFAMYPWANLGRHQQESVRFASGNPAVYPPSKLYTPPTWLVLDEIERGIYNPNFGRFMGTVP